MSAPDNSEPFSPLESGISLEYQRVLDRQAAMLEVFRDEPDPEKQAVIISGIQRLLDETYNKFPIQLKNLTYKSRLSTEEEVATAKTVLSDIFSINTTVKPKRFIENDPKNPVYPDSRILNPREVEVLMLHFGLTGEKPLKNSEIGERMGFTGERARNVLLHAGRKLRFDHNKQLLLGTVLETIEESIPTDEPPGGDIFVDKEFFG